MLLELMVVSVLNGKASAMEVFSASNKTSGWARRNSDDAVAVGPTP